MHRNRNRLDEDRLELLDKNKKELCEKVIIEMEEELDVLITKSVITQKDKKRIMVEFLLLICYDPKISYMY